MLPAGIRARLLLAILLASVPALVGISAYAVYRAQADKETAFDALREHARSMASIRGPLFDQTETLLAMLSTFPQLRDMAEDPQTCSDVLGRLAPSDKFRHVVAADVNGAVVCQRTPLALASVADQLWFQRVVAHRQVVVAPNTEGSAGVDGWIDVAHPIFADGEQLLGVLNAAISLSWLNERMAAFTIPDHMVVALLDSEGTILVRHPAPERFIGAKAPEDVRRAVELNERGAFEITMLDGVRRMFAFEPVGQKGVGRALTLLVAAEPSFLWAPLRRLVGLQLGTLALVLALGVLAALATTNWLVVRPVRALQRAVDAYTAGDRTARAVVDPPRKGEIAYLAGAFNTMADALNRQESALRRTNAQKTRYLSIASHDLRQPLQTILLVLQADLQGPNARESIARAQRACERLRHELDLLAEVVRADLRGADAVLKVRATPLAPLLARVAEANREQAAAKGLQLRIAATPCVVASEESALFTIVNNLVMNAVAYTTQGRIVVGCRRSGDACRIEVHDTGPGISPKHLDSIFEAFNRLQPESSPGLGLGLTIVKETAEYLGHKIGVRSRPGKGSCFSVEVPLWKGQGA